MADAVTTQVLMNGSKNLIIKFTNLSDGTGESVVRKVDASAYGCTHVHINDIIYDMSGMSASLYWEATVNQAIAHLGGSGTFPGDSFGPIFPPDVTGLTGDILLTTTGHASGDSYTIILKMVKK